jgi:hypothetical protein
MQNFAALEKSLDCEISVAEIYAGIEFEPRNPPRFPFDVHAEIINNS